MEHKPKAFYLNGKRVWLVKTDVFFDAVVVMDGQTGVFTEYVRRYFYKHAKPYGKLSEALYD